MAGNKDIRIDAKAKFMMNLKRRLGRMAACCRVGLMLALMVSPLARAASPWEQPAAQLAAQVAEILGAGQAQLTVNNRSTIATQDLPAIRRLLEQDLRARGVVTSGAESANMIRVTLSENARERLWVAEVVEGNSTQVAMTHLDREPMAASAVEAGMVLEKKRVWDSLAIVAISGAPVLAALETKAALVVLEQDDIVVFTMTAVGWGEDKRFPVERQSASSRDARGMLEPAADGFGFTAYTAGTECSGSYVPSMGNSVGSGDWTVRCHESDDPWPVIGGPLTLGPIVTGMAGVHAFYNASRDFFTGVITPGPGVDLMPFYSMAALPRGAMGGTTLLVNGINGKVQMVVGNALKRVTGTRDWGSDFVAIRSGCGSGTQILVSSSGEGESDSLRAYELAAQEAVAVSAPLEMGGTVTSLSMAPDGVSVWAVVRKGAKDYEVDRVTALCP
jgi:hypothetical protein